MPTGVKIDASQGLLVVITCRYYAHANFNIIYRGEIDLKHPCKQS